MIGHFKHPPNRDAIHWVKRDIWPKIKKLMPSATLDVFGAHPDKTDMMLSDPSSGFRVVGPIKAEELTTRLQRARVNLAPLRYGAGIKGKITENWFSGTPTVSTSIGSESMTSYFRNAETGTMHPMFGGEIADDAESFARSAVGLYIDPTRWHRARGAGYEILTHNFSMTINGPLLQDILWKVVEERERIRDHNLVGSILWSAGYRYNEMFGRFVQMKTLASQRHAQSFVSSLGDQLKNNGAKTSEASSDSVPFSDATPTTKKRTRAAKEAAKAAAAAAAAATSSSSSSSSSADLAAASDPTTSDLTSSHASSSTSSSNSASSASSHSTLIESPPSFNADHEKEDTELQHARGLSSEPSGNVNSTRETFIPKRQSSSSSSSTIRSHAASILSNDTIKSELEENDRQFVFGVLAAEQERLTSRLTPHRPSRPSSSHHKFGLTKQDESAFVAFKKNLK